MKIAGIPIFATCESDYLPLCLQFKRSEIHLPQQSNRHQLNKVGKIHDRHIMKVVYVSFDEMVSSLVPNDRSS